MNLAPPPLLMTFFLRAALSSHLCFSSLIIKKVNANLIPTIAATGVRDFIVSEKLVLITSAAIKNSRPVRILLVNCCLNVCWFAPVAQYF